MASTASLWARMARIASFSSVSVFCALTASSSAIARSALAASILVISRSLSTRDGILSGLHPFHVDADSPADRQAIVRGAPCHLSGNGTGDFDRQRSGGQIAGEGLARVTACACSAPSYVMSQHFLLSRPAKTLSLAQVFRMTDTEAEAMFRKVRWPETDGAPVCPHCGGLNAYECRRPSTTLAELFDCILTRIRQWGHRS